MAVSVCVITKKNRPSLYLLAKDPETGERFERVAGTNNKKAARKLAAEWQFELSRGIRPERITWLELLERFEAEHLTEVATSTRADVMASLRLFVSMAHPKKLKDVNEGRVAKFRKCLKEKYDSTATINKHLRNLRTTINWASGQKLILDPPAIKELKTEKGTESKGRPITAEEFDLMVSVAERTLGVRRGEWVFLLRGLWWSGLRLGEAMSLSWDEWHDGLTVDLTGEFPLLRIPAKHQKSRRHELKPLAPEFAEMLLTVPEHCRTGFVFNPAPSKVIRHPRATNDCAGRMIVNLGKLAGVVVQQDPKLKFASAHDLRRAFGHRWSRKVMPAVLKDLMRHADISTTMDYYVCNEAEETARILYGLVGRKVDQKVDLAQNQAGPDQP